MGQGENGLVMTLALVSFALVVRPADGVGAQGGDGGGEHGALEPLVAAVGDMLAPDGGARSSGHRCQAGVGGQLGAGAWRSCPGSRPARTAAAGTPDPGHGDQDLIKRVGLHQGLDLGGGIGPLGVQGDELPGQVR